jgi:hypothetical protein
MDRRAAFAVSVIGTATQYGVQSVPLGPPGRQGRTGFPDNRIKGIRRAGGQLARFDLPSP